MSCGPAHEERGGREMAIHGEPHWGKTGACGGCIPEKRTATNRGGGDLRPEAKASL
jgi:hypothetical protein